MTVPGDGDDGLGEHAEIQADDLDIVARRASNGTVNSTGTLLPSPFASLVSLTTSTSLLSLRAAAFLGGFAIKAARTGTLTGFELGRVVFEGILSRAGNGLTASRTGEAGRAAAEGLLQKALLTLHSSITSTAFLVSTGFEIGSTSLTSSLSIAQYFLSALDAILGDTQSSRAVATIVTLVQREFKDPHTGLHGEKVGLADILVGTIAFVVLQRWGEKQTQQELEHAGVQELVWDVVVVPEGQDPLDADLDNVNHPEDDEVHTPEEPRRLTRTVSFVSAHGNEEAFDAVGDGRSFISRSSFQTGHSLQGIPSSSAERLLKQDISNQLPPGTRVSLNAELRTQDIVTVDLESGEDIPLEPPQGFSLISTQHIDEAIQRFVFQRKSKRRRRASFVASTNTEYDRPPSSIVDDVSMDFDRQPYPETPTREVSSMPTFGTTDIPTTPITANQKRTRTPLRQMSDVTAAGPDAYTTTSVSFSHPVTKEATAQTPLRKSLRHKKSVRKLVDFWNREPKLPLPRSQDSTQQPPQQATLERILRGNATPQPAPSTEDTYNGDDKLFSRATDGAPQIPNRRHAAERRSQHCRSRSSFYSVRTDASDQSLVPYAQDDNFELPVAAKIRRDGLPQGTFPPWPLSSNSARFAKFAIASYGSTFLRLTNSWQEDEPMPSAKDVLPQHQSFASYIDLPPASVLLSSYVDPFGGSPASLDPDHGLPLVNFIAVDHETRSVVLTCRGTLGFEDILTDLTGDYDDVTWLGEQYKVHKGILASARRLLTLQNGRALATITAALEEFKDYGLVLCGHSLGGSVAATMAILLASRSTTSAGGCFRYCTSREPVGLKMVLPPNRPIHAYAYGPAACFSPQLQEATRGLVTTVVLGQDAVPYLSLGTLLDFQTMALAFKTDSHDAKAEVMRRIKDGICNAFHERSGLGAFDGLFASEWRQSHAPDEDHWPWIALKSLRASMLADKLVPPGEVYHVESQPVLQRHAFVEASSGKNSPKIETRSFRPATRIKFTHVVDVETKFREMRFGGSMFADHFPGRYEKVLQLLDTGLGG